MMEIDDLKQAWQSLGHKLERSEAIQWQLLRERKLDKVRRSLRPLFWGQALQILLGIGLVLLGVACWSRNPGTPALFAIGIAVHVFGVVNIVMAGITMGMIRRIDDSAPVVSIQKQNARLLRFYLLNSNVCGLSWWVMWLPITLALAGAGRIHLAAQAPGYVWSGTVISLLGLAGTWFYFRWMHKRAAASGQMNESDRFDVADGGDGIRRSQRLLDEIARFERE